MKAYLINLDTDTERLAFMADQFQASGVAWERVSGVDLRGPTGRAAMAGWSHLPRARLSPPEVGCLMSHAKVWQMILDSGDAHGCIFEDDIHVSRRLGALLSRNDWIPPSVDLLRVETSLAPVNLGRALCEIDGTRLCASYDNRIGTAGYIISARRARQMLAALDANAAAADYFLFSDRPKLVHQLDPGLCVQTHHTIAGLTAPIFGSNIQGSRQAMHAEAQKPVVDPIAQRRRSPVWRLTSRVMRLWLRVRWGATWRSVPFQP